MIPTLYNITPAVNLRAIQTDRFKNAQLSVSLILPADKELSPLTTLLFSVLRRGTEQYPTIKELNLVLDMLYGASISYRNTFFGDSQAWVSAASCRPSASCWWSTVRRRRRL